MPHYGDGWEGIVILRWETVSCRVKLWLVGFMGIWAGRVNRGGGLVVKLSGQFLSSICAWILSTIRERFMHITGRAREVFRQHPAQKSQHSQGEKKKSYWATGIHVKLNSEGLIWNSAAWVLIGIRMQTRREMICGFQWKWCWQITGTSQGIVQHWSHIRGNRQYSLLGQLLDDVYNQTYIVYCFVMAGKD